jgi:hypothetical protein
VNSAKVVLNIAERGSSTSGINLERAIDIARKRASRSRYHSKNSSQCSIVANVQPYSREPILSLADYTLWAVQRVLEKGETRFYNYLKDKIRFIVDLYDYQGQPSANNVYKPNRPLSDSNKINPPNG